MAENPIYAATTKDGRNIEVYRLQAGGPIAEHIWCEYPNCTTTHKADDLKYLKKKST